MAAVRDFGPPVPSQSGRGPATIGSRGSDGWPGALPRRWGRRRRPVRRACAKHGGDRVAANPGPPVLRRSGAWRAERVGAGGVGRPAAPFRAGGEARRRQVPGRFVVGVPISSIRSQLIEGRSVLIRLWHLGLALPWPSVPDVVRAGHVWWGSVWAGSVLFGVALL